MTKWNKGIIKLHLDRTLEEVLGDEMGVTGVRLRSTKDDHWKIST